jgi:class 3 adenylate cyclase
VAAFFQKHRTGSVALVFTNLVDSSALLSKLGDQAGATFLKQRREIIRDKVKAIPEGEEIETAGDSFLLVFSKPSDAVRFALLVQAQLRSFSEASNLPVLGW